MCIRDRSIAEQQLVEILRGLMREARLLILDEPTSALTFGEVQSLSLIHIFCGAADPWDEDAMMNLAVERIRQAAPEGRVLCAVSGGVDSTRCV